ncbi:tetratricopeptide repeat protein [Ruegeria arenilitoris]|uniref:tetratricopeptide repeat protein n=1 Tax=Ruegeria arenilitoris TaxID=1173585 RepID=UPI00147D6A3F|nr:hypothetical protein [Ruegeria arenilitoris]
MRFRFTVAVVAVASLGFALSAGAEESTKVQALMDDCQTVNEAPSEAYEACSQLLKMDGLSEDDRFDALFFRGAASFVVEQYTAATQDLTEALEIQPDSVPALAGRALAFIKMGDLERAEQDNAKALSLDFENKVSLLNVARIENSRGDIQAAIRASEKVLDVDPNDSDAYMYLMERHYETGGLTQVTAFLDRASHRWPDADWVFDIQLFTALNYTGDVEAAVSAVSQRARRKLDPANEAFTLALIHLKIGDEAKGIEYVRKFTELYFFRQPIVEQLYQSALSWGVFGRSDRWVIRMTTYAVIGRRDLAKAEIDDFLRDTGENGRTVFLGLVQKAGVPVPEEAQAGSRAHLEDTILRYLDHVEDTGGFSVFGLANKD